MTRWLELIGKGFDLARALLGRKARGTPHRGPVVEPITDADLHKPKLVPPPPIGPDR